MKKITLYLILLITPALSSKLMAQNRHVKDITWAISAEIPPAAHQAKSLGVAGAVVGISHHIVIVAGGTNFPDKLPWNGGKKRYYDEIFLYKKTSQDLNLLPSKAQAKLPFNLAYAAVCSTSHGIVIAGGENENGLSKKVILLNWKANQLQLKNLPDLPNGLTNAALTVVDELIYLAGGEIQDGATDQFLSLNLKAPQEGWKKLANLPHAVSHTVLLSSNAKGKEIFLIGGRKRNQGDTSTIYQEVYAFDREAGTWNARKSLPYSLSAAAGVSEGKHMLVFSGDKGETFHKAEKLIAAVEKEQDPTKKELLNQQKIEIQSTHPGFSTTVLKYSLSTDTWVELKTPMPYGTVTTPAVRCDDEIIIAGGEIKAGIRTPHILIGKLIELK